MATYIDGDHWLGKQILDEIVVQQQWEAELTLIHKLGLVVQNNGKEFYYDYDCIRGRGDTAAKAMTDFYRKFFNQIL